MHTFFMLAGKLELGNPHIITVGANSLAQRASIKANRANELAPTGFAKQERGQVIA